MFSNLSFKIEKKIFQENVKRLKKKKSQNAVDIEISCF